MEKWYVEGFRKVSFTDTRTKKDVDGYTLFLSRDPVSDKVQGRECQKLFFGSGYCSYEPVVGDEVTIFYNKYGKVDNITAC